MRQQSGAVQAKQCGSHLDRRAALLAEGAGIANLRASGDTHFKELSHGRVLAISRQAVADRGWVATDEDVTKRRRTEAQIGRDREFAVFLLDLDRFKAANDTLGHWVGDELLGAVAERLQACVREVDTVARLGSDEFAIIQCGLEKAAAAVLARRIVEVVGKPYDLDGQRVVIGTSVGISVAPADGGTSGKLLKNADVAL